MKVVQPCHVGLNKDIKCSLKFEIWEPISAFCLNIKHTASLEKGVKEKKRQIISNYDFYKLNHLYNI